MALSSGPGLWARMSAASKSRWLASGSSSVVNTGRAMTASSGWDSAAFFESVTSSGDTVHSSGGVVIGRTVATRHQVKVHLELTRIAERVEASLALVEHG